MPEDALLYHFGQRFFESKVFVDDVRVWSIISVEDLPTFCLVLSLLGVDEMHRQPSQKESYFLESVEREDSLLIQGLQFPHFADS